MRCKKRDYQCRPAANAQAEANLAVGDHIVWRLAHNGRWAPDNGKPGLAFAAGFTHYYPDVECDCFSDDKCVSRISAAKVLKQVSCANGRGQRPTRVRKAKKP